MSISGHDPNAHFNDIINGAESTQKIFIYVIIASLKSESLGKLINIIPGSPLLIAILPGKASRTHVESLWKPDESTSVLRALPGKLDIKRHSPSILYLLSLE